jgi:hypothetical protein
MQMGALVTVERLIFCFSVQDYDSGGELLDVEHDVRKSIHRMD